MESEFNKGTIVNVLRSLCDEQALLFFGLSTACNDLTINLDAMGKFPTSENSYFFYSSISIVREIALLVDRINKTNFLEHYSNHTKKIFAELDKELGSFKDESIAKKTLRPIRNLTFHYNMKKSGEIKKITSVLHQLREEPTLEVGIKPGVENPLGQRYTFADDFRTEVINQYLSTELVSRISAIAANIGSLVDSLIADLVEKQS